MESAAADPSLFNATDATTTPRMTVSSGMTPDKSSPSGAGHYAFMSARSMVKLDTNAGKPSLTPLH
jgi:hypothetical protein